MCIDVFIRTAALITPKIKTNSFGSVAFKELWYINKRKSEEDLYVLICKDLRTTLTKAKFKIVI